MPQPLTTRQVADEITRSPVIPGTVEEWQVRRLFEDGDLPEVPKFGGKRMVDHSLVPEIVEALRNRGWLPAQPVIQASR